MVKLHKFQKWAFSALITLGLVGYASATCAPTPCTGFRTQTQGGWGTRPSGNNPGTVLANNFAAVFPSGIQIGCTDKLMLTSTLAVRNYLKGAGTPKALSPGVVINPTSGGGTFGVQMVALAINIQMDLAIPSFSSSTTNLKDLVISTGDFAGWTVQQFFDEANKKIGGCSAANFSFSAYNDVASKINENYVDGTTQKNYLNCPAFTLSGVQTQSTVCACNGTAKVTVLGGKPPYSYSWSNGASGTNELTGLCALPSLSVTVTDANGCTKIYNFGPITQKEGCSAVEVTSYVQGLRQNFTPVDANRSVGAAMLGAPQNTDALGTFFSLGFGGWAILRVDGSIVDKPGNDLKVVETTWHTWACARYTEKALIEVSQDNVTWYSKGILCQDGEIDIAPLPCISYVRITDVSDRANFVTELPLADGFDVDGIICLNPPAANGRQAVASTEVVQELSQNVKRNISMYPNPADNQLFVNVSGASEGENMILTIVDHMGREVKSMNITALGANHKAEVRMDDLKPGMYIVRVNGAGINATKKITKK